VGTAEHEPADELLDGHRRAMIAAAGHMSFFRCREVDARETCQ
jgi:hypothetical protein